MRKHKGFTLVEILIVVVILGILAAIVIPQFSEASTEARVNSLASNLQSIRSQLSLYRVQHNDNWPLEADLENAMLLCSNQLGTDFEARSDTNRASHPFGPYLQSIPTNPFTGGRAIGTDWLYNEGTGAFTAATTGITNTDVLDKIAALNGN